LHDPCAWSIRTRQDVPVSVVGESGEFIKKCNGSESEKEENASTMKALSILPSPSISVLSSDLESLCYTCCDTLFVSLCNRSFGEQQHENRHMAGNVQIGPPAPQAVGCMAMNQNHEGDGTIQPIFANLASRLGVEWQHGLDPPCHVHIHPPPVSPPAHVAIAHYSPPRRDGDGV
jgi:hypothetical protein